jgi:hypothetical protein
MKLQNRVVAFLLCISMFVVCFPISTYAAEEANDQDVKIYSVPIISNVYTGGSVDFYEYKGKYYLDVQVIKELTRCTVEEADSIIKMVHGIREIEINKSDGHMVDSAVKDQGNIPFVTYNGKYLCEGIPMLSYLGAGCNIRNNSLEVLMPTITIWESIMPDYLDYIFNAVELYGGENNVKISLICDILSDILNGAGGHGLFADGDTHLEEALYEILDVNIIKYGSVQETMSAQNQDINDFMSSDALMNVLEAGTDAHDTVKKTVDYYANFFLESEIYKNEALWTNSFNAGNWDECSKLSTEINKEVYEQSVLQSNLGKGRGVSEFLDVGMLALDTAVTSYSLMKYDEDTKTLFSKNINRDIFTYADYNNISWNNVSDRITRNLSSNSSIVKSTAIKNIKDFAIDKGTEMGAKGALSFFTTKANIYVAATKLAVFLTSLAFLDLHKAYSADMNAIWLSTVQFDIAQLATRALLKSGEDERFENIESMEKLRNLMALYYRTTIAFSENFAISLDEFGGKNKAEWVSWFSDKNGNSVSNYMAAYLYRITNCTIVPFVDYAGLSDALIKADWIKDFERKSLSDGGRGNSVGNIVNGGLVAQSGDWVYYEHTNDGFKLYKMRVDGSEKTKLNDSISYCINVVGDWIYYINNSDYDAPQRIYKIRTDGSENTKLNDSMSNDVSVIGDWIFYEKSRGDGYSDLCKLRIDGSEEIMLYGKEVWDFCATEDWIYFTDYEGGWGYSLCKIRTDGSEKTKLNDEKAHNINIEGDWIYYTVGALEDNVVRKICTDGSGEAKVTSARSSNINVTGDWIYYSNWNDNGNLYKIRTDGSQRTKLNDDDSSVHINIIGEWIYYTMGFGNGNLFRIRTDGTERQIITQ